MTGSSPSPIGKPLAFGFVEWFRPGEHERVKTALASMRRTGATSLRTALSWAEYHNDGGREWYDWLIPTLAEHFELLPCVHYTPPSLSRTGRSSGPPRRLQDYADFVDHVLTRYGRHLDHIELWNEPNNLLDWDWRADPDHLLFSEMIGAAGYWATKVGFKPVLGGPCPFDSKWLELMGERGVLGVVSAIGLHGFPGTWDSEEGAWLGWPRQVEEARAILRRYNPAAEIWITETGYSTWRRDEIVQVERFLAALTAPVDRIYWYGWQDLAGDVAVQEGHRFDQRHYHLGVTTESGRPKLLARLLSEGGVAMASTTQDLAMPAVLRHAHPIVVLGGAGFIGSNLADSYLSQGREVVVLDDLSRPGVERNLHWLKDRHGARVHPLIASIRNDVALREPIADASAIFHLAAQVAVTTSLDVPVEDFETNARGTLNVLEAARRSGRRIPIVFASTNKVYGNLDDVALEDVLGRYLPADPEIRSTGISEHRNLDFCTPYGCSKGVADQYVLDYAKTFGLPTAVLRMSCIYGPRQFGTEDQGWVAHFLIRALACEPITIYGDGRQVRDILHVRDAVAAYRAVLESIDHVRGRAFNLGGGPENMVSLRMVLSAIERLTGRPITIDYARWRPGDQKYFVADIRELAEVLDWRPSVSWRDGIADLTRWLTGQQPGTAAGSSASADASLPRRLEA
ncbi:NAD-dependent epimerase/dehydratase family protein [Marinivivus vitaminiproducens]|uniref:NAD-dependent epimerase/dehydratase family protein n=1 Tax=Marinivivus vitaminiproducens TaxID=3035935 RepID=UPI00279B679B|nr:NAD-dependent epimerase/dehydratase family protein [Geminicoccaceae bacterium SCSIO 64248]